MFLKKPPFHQPLFPGNSERHSLDLQRPPVVVTMHDDDLIESRDDVWVTGAFVCTAGNSCVVPTPGCAARLALHPSHAHTHTTQTHPFPLNNVEYFGGRVFAFVVVVVVYFLEVNS